MIKRKATKAMSLGNVKRARQTPPDDNPKNSALGIEEHKVKPKCRVSKLQKDDETRYIHVIR
jgi:hypothetical protein